MRIFSIASFGVVALFATPAQALLDQWGSGASTSVAQCASFSLPECGVATNFSFGAYVDNFQLGSAMSSITDSLGTSLAYSDIVRVVDGLNVIELRARAAGGSGVAFAEAWGLEGYRYFGPGATISIDITMEGTVTNPGNSAFASLRGSVYALSESDLDGFGTTDIGGCLGECFTPMGGLDLFIDTSGSATDSFSLTLAPGDTFYLWGRMNATNAIGGVTESLNTLSFDFGGDTTGLESIGTAVVPVPAAFWLFAGSLAALARLRRQGQVAAIRNPA